MANQMNIQDCVQNGFMLYKNNFVLLLLAGVIALVLSMFSFGILAGPLMAGTFMIVLRLIREPYAKPMVGDIFKGFELFGQTFLFTLVWVVIMIVGLKIISILPVFLEQLVGFLFSIVVLVLSQFGIILIADKKMSFRDASMAGIKLAQDQFPYLFAFTIIWVLIGSLGSILYLVGVVLTQPLAFCMIAYAYLDLFNGQGNVRQQ